MTATIETKDNGVPLSSKQDWPSRADYDPNNAPMEPPQSIEQSKANGWMHDGAVMEALKRIEAIEQYLKEPDTGTVLAKELADNGYLDTMTRLRHLEQRLEALEQRMNQIVPTVTVQPAEVRIKRPRAKIIMPPAKQVQRIKARKTEDGSWELTIE